MYRVSGFIEIKLGSRKLASSLAQALRVEASKPPDPRRGEALVSVRDTGIVIRIKARDFSAARTLFNTYLALTASALTTILDLEENEEKQA